MPRCHAGKTNQRAGYCNEYDAFQKKFRIHLKTPPPDHMPAGPRIQMGGRQKSEIRIQNSEAPAPGLRTLSYERANRERRTVNNHESDRRGLGAPGNPKTPNSKLQAPSSKLQAPPPVIVAAKE